MQVNAVEINSETLAPIETTEHLIEENRLLNERIRALEANAEQIERLNERLRALEDNAEHNRIQVNVVGNNAANRLMNFSFRGVPGYLFSGITCLIGCICRRSRDHLTHLFVNRIFQSIDVNPTLSTNEITESSSNNPTTFSPP